MVGGRSRCYCGSYAASPSRLHHLLLAEGDCSGHISTPLQSSLLPCNLTAVARPPPSTLPHTCAQDGAEMRDAIKARCPSKIDIGPVYSCNPKDRLKFGSECGAGASVEGE